MNSLKIKATLTPGPLGWINEVNAAFQQISELAVPVHWCTPAWLGLVDPYGGAEFKLGICFNLDANINAKNTFSLALLPAPAFTLPTMGATLDVGGQNNIVGGTLGNLKDVIRFAFGGTVTFLHAYTPGTFAYIKNDGSGTIDNSSAGSARRIGTFLPNNKLLVWPKR